MKHRAPKRRPGPWRTYGCKYPLNFDGTEYSGKPECLKSSAWFWIEKRGEMSLYIRVQGKNRAAAIARMLNLAEKHHPTNL